VELDLALDRHEPTARRISRDLRAPGGRWFGAFADRRLVSSLVLIRALPGTGRYQTVETLGTYAG
jgi:hypothetical protein